MYVDERVCYPAYSVDLRVLVQVLATIVSLANSETEGRLCGMDIMMKTVLIVAYYFPPIATSGSMRPLGFCRYLGKYGWRVRVLTTEPTSVYPFLGVDENLCAQLPDKMQIDRVPHINPERTLLIARQKFLPPLCALNSFSESEPPSNINGRDSEGKLGYRSVRKTLLDWLFAFPDRQRFWLRPALRRLSHLRSHEYPDVVYATGGPWTSLLVGKALARKFGVPFVADFRDPWTHNPNKETLSPFLFRRSLELERSICAAAARVIVNTDELRAQFVRDNPDLQEKFTTITNGFDHDGYELSSAFKDEHHIEWGQPGKLGLEICHFGSIYGNRAPSALFLAVRELFEVNQIQKGELRIRLVGDWVVEDKRCESLAQELEKNGFLQRDPPLPHDHCLRQMSSAQILLILQPAYPLQVPAKIYEYIAAGRPILVIGGEGATVALVERHRLGKCCPNEASAIKELLLLLVTGRLRIEPPRPEERETFHYNNITKKLAQVFDAVSTGAN
jgi:glycosyltransferase involved in cell wall biosynthesis